VPGFLPCTIGTRDENKECEKGGETKEEESVQPKNMQKKLGSDKAKSLFPNTEGALILRSAFSNEQKKGGDLKKKRRGRDARGVGSDEPLNLRFLQCQFTGLGGHA